MTFSSKLRLSAVAVSVLAVSVAGFALVPHAATKDAFTADQKAALNDIIHDYLMENPQVIMEAVAKHQVDQEQAQVDAMKDLIVTKKDALFNDAGKPVAGNPKGSVVIAEFYDYNCGYCKHAFSDMAQILESDKDVKFVMIDFPILSETSHMAAKYALAAGKQGKYFEMHSRLMKLSGQMREEQLQDIGKDLGLDVEQMKKDADSADVAKQIESNIALARELGISGTPGFIINETPVRGYLGLEGMQSIIAEERAKLTKKD
ncbi:DsbA family protein [Micavibrio aeruginosavorus]|uniref:27 kDa outer membrane protein, putative n=1 Tax=Micavibrio aeruginosavorus EPB TaxID=349215 RepID=M4W0R9_9BACT|nr:DsbA family protein [Micavibrio aeruginosavorus]AGH99014.1 27 kDa outer membrane protein, putative [Micavibrio aeruginosavorus EPB]